MLYETDPGDLIDFAKRWASLGVTSRHAPRVRNTWRSRECGSPTASMRSESFVRGKSLRVCLGLSLTAPSAMSSPTNG